MDTLELYIDLGKFPSDKKYKERMLKEIVAYLCALMNDSGGEIKFNFNKVQKNAAKRINSFIRIVEQSCTNIVGTQMTVLNLDTRIVCNNVMCTVKKSEFFITTHYNLYLPSTTQVLSVSSTENIKDNILTRQHVYQPVQLGSHHKSFVRHTFCNLTEDKQIQLKLLEAGAKNCTKLVQRMINNKLIVYVSAFANHNGGHIYYGITDDGVVAGEKIPTDEDIIEIIKKVEKAIKKMIWPEHIGQPKRGKHWNIFFEPVVDENSKPIPSTYVIVIYIAPCLGGVFTEEPECYEMVEGKVNKMSFATWKERILGPVEVESVPHAIGRSTITWISKKTQKLCTRAFCILANCLNNGGDLKGFRDKSNAIKQMFPANVELQLVVLLKEIIAHSRKQHFKTADKLLDEYDKLLPNATEHHMFEVLGLCERVEVTRPNGELNRIRDLLVGALDKAGWLSPGLVTALVYLFAGTIMHLFEAHSSAPNVLLHNALQHLQQVMSDCPEERADLEYKAHINLATFYLGCHLSGELVDKHVDDIRLKQANSSIMAIEQSERKLTHYREVQLNLVKSIYRFRRSENQPNERMRFLREAFEYSKKSENLAWKWKFFEMVSWSKSLQGLITEKLVRANVQ